MTTLQKLIEQYKNQGLRTKEIKHVLELSESSADKFRIIAQQRIFGVPWEYITREVTFFGKKFFVDQRAYIPNPETEVMVQAVIEELKPEQVVLDVGTGCGNIAITVKKARPDTAVVGSDIDQNALEVAKKNTACHKTQIDLKHTCYVYGIDIKPDVIVADLPYGSEQYLLTSNLNRNITSEPSMACFHPTGPFKAYEELIESIQSRCWQCQLFIETGTLPKQTVAKYMPSNLEWQYIKSQNYSFTIIVFN
jgi:release factor glutamine methyltransferase